MLEPGRARGSVAKQSSQSPWRQRTHVAFPGMLTTSHSQSSAIPAAPVCSSRQPQTTWCLSPVYRAGPWCLCVADAARCSVFTLHASSLILPPSYANGRLALGACCIIYPSAVCGDLSFADEVTKAQWHKQLAQVAQPVRAESGFLGSLGKCHGSPHLDATANFWTKTNT